MKKLTLSLLVAVALLGLVENTDVVKADAPSGDALHEKADGLRKALLSGTSDELFNKLAPWLRGRCDLFKERLPDLLEEELADAPADERGQWETELHNNIIERITDRDPAGKLGVKTFEDVLKLSAANMYAADVGQLRLQADEELKPNRDAKWHEVDRAIFTAEEKLKWAPKGALATRTFGTIAFVNRFNDTMEVTCVGDGNAWQVISFKAQIGTRNVKSDGTELVKDPIFKIVDKELRAAKRSEGKQLLGAARDHLRVQWARDGSVPKKISDSTELEYFDGVYFKLRDTVYKKPDADRGAVVAEPIDDEELGWGVLYFDYGSGESDHNWYDTEKELDQALKAFQTAK
ncbi:MAG: hypothetical protein KDB68_08840 [Planctomycetes bacterium]|nr:hypothetical protein [Planctomycetota bacterium]MCA8947353.1 hypothetical protein [Planctomycetota bacterium]